MAQQQIEKRQPNVYGIVGELSFESVPSIEREGFKSIDESDEHLEFDFSEVTLCSSASLALILSWMRFATKQGKSLIFKGFPPQLAGQIRSAQLKDIIPSK